MFKIEALLMKTAVLVDGGFFLKRYKAVKGFEPSDPPELVAKNLYAYCIRHIQRENYYRTKFNLPPTELYRIFYYDARPYDGDSQDPITKKAISFKKTDLYKERQALFEALKKQRKIALRLGFLSNSSKEWVIRGRHTKDLPAFREKETI